MLKGRCWVLSDQESQFLSWLSHLCWRLEEQQHGGAAEMLWIWQCRVLPSTSTAKCQQLDGDLLRVNQNFAPESPFPSFWLLFTGKQP